MTKLPDNINVATLSPEAALAWYQSIAESMAREDGVDIVKAWAKTKLLYPALAERANIGQPILSRVEAAGRYNDSGGIIGGPESPLPYADRPGRAPNLAVKLLPRASVSLPNAGNIESLGLPRDTSFEEFRAADRANGGATPRNGAAIFEALVGLQAERGLGPEAARDAARARFPELAAEADAALNANGAPQEASRKAHIGSSIAADEGSHLVAAASHDAAAAARDKVGDSDAAQMHRDMATFHRRQAERPYPA